MNPLEPIWNNYNTAIACFDVARQSITKDKKELWQKTKFISPPTTERIAESRTALDELVIVALWATFERTVIEYVQSVVKINSASHIPAFIRAVEARLNTTIEFWRIDDTLDLLGNISNSNDLGQAKQIKHFRDWIVHRNPSVRTPRKAQPDYTYRVLAKILDDITSI